MHLSRSVLDSKSLGTINKLMQHSQAHVTKNPRLYGLLAQSKMNGQSQWQSCLSVLTVEGRMILREENRVSEVNHLDSELYTATHFKDVLFCAHWERSFSLPFGSLNGGRS
jgi:hypothetical protein